ncbi:dihydroorotase [Microbacterium protaetiae]|uniref:dihydroorotase n=1 Tax=Microbacterium protaetiae TaxID=2509458 RepID=UPI001A90FD6A|nr:dihydroorotase [Microbacterium protaetiae]
MIISITASKGGTPHSPAVVLPGLVDLHTHLREPGDEDSETIRSGTAAAARGGFTDVFAMANTSPVTDSVDRLERLRERLSDARVRVHPVAAATLGLQGRDVVDVDALASAGVTMFSDDGRCVDDDLVARRILERMHAAGTVFAQHAQGREIVGDGVINARVAHRVDAPGWPTRGEEQIVARDISLAAATGGRLHVCHVSTAGTVELIRDAKRRGLTVTAEVTPHHLLLTDEDAAERGPSLKVNPPLRSPDDVRALQDALRDGTIDAIGTDHAPHSAPRKAGDWRTAAFGLTALETALPVVAELCTGVDGVDWARVASVMSHAPARIGGIDDIAGRQVAVGEPATLTLVEPGPTVVRAKEQVTRSANTPFEGRQFGWRTTLTLIEGEAAYAETRRRGFPLGATRECTSRPLTQEIT